METNERMLTVGEVVMHYGHEFQVVSVSEPWTAPNGWTRISWVGKLTDNSINDSIRGTSYDGGNYTRTVSRNGK